jgi:excinuclease ABC subunit C
LDDVPGVGPATREKLMHHFKSLVGVRAASPDALEEVVSRKVAEAIYLHFKSE